MAFVVNGEKIEDLAIKGEIERLRPDYERVFADQEPAEREAQLLDWSKENVIERVLINQEAKSSGASLSSRGGSVARAEGLGVTGGGGEGPPRLRSSMVCRAGL